MIPKLCNWTLIISLALLCCLLPSIAGAQKESPPVDTAAAPRSLTLAECLDIAVENNIGLRIARINLEASSVNLMRSQAAFDPGFELDLSTRNSDSSGSGSSSSPNSQLDLAMRYLYPTWDGSSWVISVGEGRTAGSSLSGETINHFSSYSSQVGVSYSQPLLEGHGQRINRLGVERADLGVMRGESAVNNAARSLRHTVIQSYVGAILASRQIQTAELSLQTTERLVEATQARIDAGKLAPYELLSAQAGLAERREALLNAQTAFATALDGLKEIIGLPITDDIAVVPETLQKMYLDVDPEEFYALAQRNRPDLKDIDLQVQQAQLDLMLANDREQPTLTWNATLGFAGSDDALAGSVSDLNDFSWYTGIQYRLPLGGNRVSKADVSTAKLTLDQLDLQRINFLRNLQLNVRTASDDFSNALLRIDVTAQGLEVQEVKMESEQLRYELGLITSRDLLDFDLDLANARLAHDQALADALLAVAQLEFLVNQPLLDDAVVLGSIASGAGAGSERTQ